jgi:hypothetical protein
MLPPQWAMTATATLYAATDTPGGRLGEMQTSYAPVGGPVPCANYPAGEKAIRRAGLLGVTVSREIYLNQIDLDPQIHRLEVSGIQYHVRDVSEWDGFTVAACEAVP